MGGLAHPETRLRENGAAGRSRISRDLRGRGTEHPEVIRRRLDTARIEMAAQDDFDEVVVNSRLESACAELVSLLVDTAPGPA